MNIRHLQIESHATALQETLFALGDDGSCIFSPDRQYRYALLRPNLMRQFAQDSVSGTCLFIMLNPSTADETQNDPTVTRCIGFAKMWGFATLEVCNIFAYRTPYPDLLWKQDDPVGPDNDHWIADCAKNAAMIVAAWGGGGVERERAPRVLKLLKDYRIHCLGTTFGGQPKHPLYLPKDTEPRVLQLPPLTP
jgi:hypothetical protein